MMMLVIVAPTAAASGLSLFFLLPFLSLSFFSPRITPNWRTVQYGSGKTLRLLAPQLRSWQFTTLQSVSQVLASGFVPLSHECWASRTALQVDKTI